MQITTLNKADMREAIACVKCNVVYSASILRSDDLCPDCFIDALLSQPLPEGLDDGMDALESWLS